MRFQFFVGLLGSIVGLVLLSGPVAAEEPASDLAYIKFKLTATDASGDTVAIDKAIALYLREDATVDWDSYDASKIIPSLTDEFALLAFVGEKNGEETLKAQESRPYTDDDIEVVETRLIRTTNLPADLTYTLEVTKWYEVPSDWSVKIRVDTLDEPMVFDGLDSKCTFTLGDDKSTASLAKAESDTTHAVMTSEVHRSSSKLPVELADFQAASHGTDVQLRWQTTSETNNAGFAVERRRTNGEEKPSWSKVGFVEGAGTTTQTQSYSLEVEDLDYGTHAFRLRQIDTDGTTTTTQPRTVDVQITERYEVSTPYPNPARGRATLEVTVQETQPVEIAMYDVQGRRVRTVHDGALPGQQTRRVPIDTETLASSVYVLRVRGDTFAESRRITVVR